MSGNGLRIHRLTASNVKRLQAVDITPGRNAVVVGGGNEQGKSSLLDAITMAIGGGKEVPVEVLRRGQKRGHVTVDLGDFTLTRTFKRNDNGTLKITARDGVEAPTSQTLLEKLYDRITFDPFAWALKSRTGPGQKEMREDLVRVSKLPIDIQGNLRDRAARFAERTECGRERDQLKSRAEAIPAPEEGVPDEEIDVAELVKKFQAAVKSNADRARLEERVRTQDAALERGKMIAAKSVADVEEQIADAEKRYKAWLEEVAREKARREKGIAELKTVRLQEANHAAAAAVEDLERQRQEAWDEASAAPEEIDTKAISADLEGAKETNTAVQQKKDRLQLQRAHEKKRVQYDELTSAIETLDEERSTALANAEFPIEGLGFDDDGITYDGIAFAQLAQSVKLRISVAMAMALNAPENGGPNLRVMLCRDGALLDEKHLALLIEMCKERDYQIWIETVGEGAQCAIVMEDGKVKGADDDGK